VKVRCLRFAFTGHSNDYFVGGGRWCFLGQPSWIPGKCRIRQGGLLPLDFLRSASITHSNALSIFRRREVVRSGTASLVPNTLPSR